jgi:branched-chain amino acid transport system substrate-binding protein
LLAPALASLLAPGLLAKSGKPDVTLRVGGLFSLTGNSSDLGTQCRLMMSIAAGDLGPLLEDYNATPLIDRHGVGFEIMVEDTQLDPQKAASGASNLIHRGAQFIVGPQTSSEVAMVKPITDAARVVLVSPGSTASSLSLPHDSVFRFVPDDTLESKGVAQAAASLGIKAICPVWRGDDGNRGLASSLKQFGPGLGITVAAGLEYAASGADFATVAQSLDGMVASLISTYGPGEVAVFLAAFDEGADLFNAASATSHLGNVRWFAGDGVTLSSAYLAPGPASFAVLTKLLAPTIGLPSEAQLLINPVLAQITAEGVPSPIAFSYAAYDGFVCATLAWILAGGDKSRVQDILPLVAQMHFGTTGWTVLDAAGDRAVGNFEFFGIVSQSGTYSWSGLLTQQVSS